MSLALSFSYAGCSVCLVLLTCFALGEHFMRLAVYVELFHLHVHAPCVCFVRLVVLLVVLSRRLQV